MSDSLPAQDRVQQVTTMPTCAECGLPAEVVDAYVLQSTSGPVEHTITRCVLMHHITTTGRGHPHART